MTRARLLMTINPDPVAAVTDKNQVEKPNETQLLKNK